MFSYRFVSPAVHSLELLRFRVSFKSRSQSVCALVRAVPDHEQRRVPWCDAITVHVSVRDLVLYNNQLSGSIPPSLTLT